MAAAVCRSMPITSHAPRRAPAASSALRATGLVAPVLVTCLCDGWRQWSSSVEPGARAARVVGVVDRVAKQAARIDNRARAAASRIEQATALVRTLASSPVATDAVLYAYNDEHPGRLGDGSFLREVLNRLGRRRKLQRARETLDWARRGDDGRARAVVTAAHWSELVTTACRCGKAAVAQELLVEMRTYGAEPSHHLLHAVIKASGRVGDHERALQVFRAMKVWGSHMNSDTYNYVMHACSEAGDMDSVWAVFGDMQSAGAVMTPLTYTTLIRALVKQRQPAAAVQMFNDMQDRHVQPDSMTYAAVISAHALAGDLHEAVNVFAVMPQGNTEARVFAFNTVLDAVCGDAELSRKLFLQAMHEEAYPAFVRGMVQAGSWPPDGDDAGTRQGSPDPSAGGDEGGMGGVRLGLRHMVPAVAEAAVQWWVAHEQARAVTAGAAAGGGAGSCGAAVEPVDVRLDISGYQLRRRDEHGVPLVCARVLPTLEAWDRVRDVIKPYA